MVILGFVKRIEYLPTEKIPGMFNTWNASNCIHFLLKFFDDIITKLEHLPEGTIIFAERTPFSHEFVFKILDKDADKNSTYEIITDEFKANCWK